MALYLMPKGFFNALVLCAAALLATSAAGAQDEAKPPLEKVLAELQRRSHSNETNEKSDARKSAVPGSVEAMSNNDLQTLAKNLSSQIESRAIYHNEDKRKDWYELKNTDVEVKSVATASVALFAAWDVNEATDSTGLRTYTIKMDTLQSKQNLCKPDANRPSKQFADFSKQFSGAFCSGALISPNQVLTAGHCVQEITNEIGKGVAVADIAFVFGFRVTGDGELGRTTFGADEVYKAASVDKPPKGKFDSSPGSPITDLDWAIVTLDREVAPGVATPIGSRVRLDKIGLDEPVYTMGYPSGLPFKYAAGAKVINNSPDSFFFTDLDTFAGNSGSPVFDSNNRLAGILVRGATDYVNGEGKTAGKCNKALGCCIPNVCPGLCSIGSGDQLVIGEGVTRISLVDLHNK
jgi:V8-like Glu-specific endopeptidase